MTDDEFERLMQERFPPITVIHPATGRVVTYEYSKAKKEISFGRAVETIPRDPEKAERWLSDLRENAVAAWTDRERKNNAKYHVADQPWLMFQDYEAWCAENDTYSLPADASKVIRWLLERIAAGKMEISRATLAASAVSGIHDFANHPPRHLAATVVKDFHRALDFAKTDLRKSHSNIFEIGQMTPARALEMFPDGNIPRSYDDIAA